METVQDLSLETSVQQQRISRSQSRYSFRTSGESRTRTKVLRSFLRSSIGKQWSVIYSELCYKLQNFKWLFVGEIERIVELKPVFQQETPCKNLGEHPLRPGSLYVDTHGILQEVPWTRLNKKGYNHNALRANWLLQILDKLSSTI